LNGDELLITVVWVVRVVLADGKFRGGLPSATIRFTDITECGQVISKYYE
jgi:hypothetical protein